MPHHIGLREAYIGTKNVGRRVFLNLEMCPTAQNRCVSQKRREKVSRASEKAIF
jgi:hypothetical protein